MVSYLFPVSRDSKISDIFKQCSDGLLNGTHNTAMFAAVVFLVAVVLNILRPDHREPVSRPGLAEVPHL